MPTLSLDDVSLDYAFWGPHDSPLPPLVLLHDASGARGAWGDFPERVVRATGCRVYAYSREGYGNSDGLDGPLAPGYLERQGREVLTAFRQALGLEEVILLGVLEGATMALVHAGQSELKTLGVVAISPVLFVDDTLLAAVGHMVGQLESPAQREALAATPANQEQTFRQWAALWASPSYRAWHVDDAVRLVTCPVLAIRGEHDAVTSPDHLVRLAGLAPDVETLTIAGCRQHPHLEKPQAVTSALVAFIKRLVTEH